MAGAAVAIIVRSVFRDLRYALRSLRRSPGFVGVAVVCLGVGLGIATTVFAMLDAVVRPHVPYRHPERIFSVWLLGNGATRQIGFAERLEAMRASSGMFEAMIVLDFRMAAPIEAYGRLHEVEQGVVAPDYFGFFGLEPRRGRFFQASDAGQPVAVVTDDVWNQLFTGRSVGEARFSLDGASYTVVGVLPRGTRHPVSSGVLLPLREAGAETTFRGGWPYVRLRPGQDSAAAARELATIAARLQAAYGVGRTPFHFRLNSVRPDPFQLGEIQTALAAGGLAVLLIACANLANLMLARGLSHRRDMVLHLALGATRTAVVRQMLAEAIVVSLAGGLLGLITTLWGASILRGGVPESLQGAGVLQPQIGWRVFLFGFVAALGSALLFGLAPALRASDVRASDVLKDGAGTTTERSRSRYSGIVVSEVAVTLVLLVGASLLVRTIAIVRHHEYGTEARGLISGNVWVSPAPTDTSRHRRYTQPPYEVLRDVASRVPGVVSVAAEARLVPWGYTIVAEQGTGPSAPLWVSGYVRVSPDYSRTRGMTIIAGRDFTEGDVAGPGAVIVDSVTATKLWPNGQWTDRMIKLGNAHHTDTPWLRVVGISRPLPHFNTRDPYELPPAEVYAVLPGPMTRAGLLARVRGDEGQATMALLRGIRERHPGQRIIAQLIPWRQGFEDFLAARRFIGRIFIAFALLALALAATGLYAVLSYAVSRRLREFAIRLALGAAPRELAAIVGREAGVMVLAGTALGGLVALWTSRFVDPYLYGVYFVDAPALIAAETVLLGTAALACAGPVRRAMRANPVEILRAT